MEHSLGNDMKLAERVLNKFYEGKLSKEEVAVMDDILDNDNALLRNLMDKEDIKIANKLVKKGLVRKGTSDDKQSSVQFSLTDQGEKELKKNETTIDFEKIAGIK
jgi:DNA-binding MarR family transcriptional regulator